LEGQGSLRATGPCSTTAGCPGIFTGTVVGPPLGSVDLTFNVSVISLPFGVNVFPGCSPASGSGQLSGGELALAFTGEFCRPPGSSTFTLKGSVEVYTTQLCPASGPWMAMSGAFDAFGEMHTSGPTPTPAPSPANPLPAGPNQAIISIIGSAGQLPAPCPSP